MNLRRATLLIGAVLFSHSLPGCSRTRPGTVGAAADTSAFAVVARAVVDETPFPIQVDPRPIRRDAPPLLAATDFVAISPDDLERRRAVLRRLGIAEGNAIMPGNCAGVLLPDKDPATVTDCPRIQRNVAAIGAPQLDSSRLVADSTVAAQPCWRSRVVVGAAGPSGRSSVASDFVLERSGGQWRFVKQLIIRVIE